MFFLWQPVIAIKSNKRNNICFILAAKISIIIHKNELSDILLRRKGPKHHIMHEEMLKTCFCNWCLRFDKKDICLQINILRRIKSETWFASLVDMNFLHLYRQTKNKCYYEEVIIYFSDRFFPITVADLCRSLWLWRVDAIRYNLTCPICLAMSIWRYGCWGDVQTVRSNSTRCPRKIVQAHFRYVYKMTTVSY